MKTYKQIIQEWKDETDPMLRRLEELCRRVAEEQKERNAVRNKLVARFSKTAFDPYEDGKGAGADACEAAIRQQEKHDEQ